MLFYIILIFKAIESMIFVYSHSKFNNFKKTKCLNSKHEHIIRVSAKNNDIQRKLVSENELKYANKIVINIIER